MQPFLILFFFFKHSHSPLLNTTLAPRVVAVHLGAHHLTYHLGGNFHPFMCLVCLIIKKGEQAGKNVDILYFNWVPRF